MKSDRSTTFHLHARGQGDAAHHRKSPPARLAGAAVLAGCLLGVAVGARADANQWSGGGSDMNWSTAGNWTNGVPTSVTDVYFRLDGGVADSLTVNNVVNEDTTIQNLRYLLDTNAMVFHNTFIADGKTLLVANPTGTTNVFLVGAETSVPSGRIPATTFTGLEGILAVNAPAGPVIVRNGGITMYGGGAKLDLSGLGTFKVHAKQMLLAGDGTNFDLDGKGDRYKDRAQCQVILAQTNELRLVATSATEQGLVFANGIGNSANGSTLKLGLTNAIFTDTGVLFGGPKSGTSTVSFNVPDSTAYFRNTAGTGPQSYWGVGDPWAGYGQAGINFTADFSDGTIDAWVTQIIVGRSYRDAARITSSYGTLRLGRGQVVADSMLIGYDYVDYCAAVNGSVQVGGTASLIVSNTLQLGRFLKTTATNGYSSAKLEINDSGSVMALGGLVSSFTSAENFDSQLTVNSGNLYVRGPMGPFLDFTIYSGSLTMDFDRNANPSSPVCSATNLMTGAPCTLTVKGVALTVGQFPLIKYGTLLGGGADDFTTVNLPTQIQGYLSNNVANSSIDLVITEVLTTTWAGNINDDWDIGATANWKDNGGNPASYQQASVPGDLVQFDDTAAGSGRVNLTSANLAPTGITVDNSAKAYSFNGVGRLTGPAGLFKKGSGTLTIANTGGNDFSGPVRILAGTLKLSGGANRLPVTSEVTVDGGATLDLGSEEQVIRSLSGAGGVALGSGALAITGGGSYAGVIQGAGPVILGGGNLVLSGANQYSGGTEISGGTVTAQNAAGSALGSGGVTISGTAVLTLGAGGAAGQVDGIITNNTAPAGVLGLAFNRSDTYTFTNFLTGTGAFKKNGLNTMIIATPNDFSGYAQVLAGVLRISHPDALGAPATPGLNWSTYIGNAANTRLELSNNITVPERFLFASRSGVYPNDPLVLSVSGTNVLAGNITLTSGGTIYNFQAAAGSKLVLAGPIVPWSGWVAGIPYYELGGAGDGEILSGLPNAFNLTGVTNSLFKDGAGSWTLWGSNTYIGATVVTNGTLIVNGAITGQGKMGNGPPGIIYKDVSVFPLGTLRGAGLITAPVTVAGTLAPGTPASFGRLTISNALTLQAGSTCAFRLSPTGSAGCDEVAGLSSVTYGGTLKVTLLPGKLIGGEVFRLFRATAYHDSFASINLPPIDPPLAWDTTQLGTDGTLRVSGALGPQNITVGGTSVGPDGNIVIQGGSSLTGWNFRVLASSDLGDPNGWAEIGGGSFAGGVFSFTDLGSTNHPQRFYRVVAP